MAELTKGGISALIPLKTVVIREKVTMMKSKYTVQTVEGTDLFYVKEDPTMLRALIKKSERPFEMEMVDTQNRAVMHLRRPYTFGADKMEVKIGGKLISVVRQEITFLKPVLNVNDAANKPLFRIKGPAIPREQCDYKLFTTGKQEIGAIKKIWGGMAKEVFTCADDFVITFPEDLDANYKAVFIGACFLIDFLYYG